jgi:hypothetical protein
MRRASLLTLSLVFLTVSVAFADEWNKTYNLTGTPDLKVTTSDASLQVSTWDQNKIEAHVITEGYKIGDNGLHITERQTGNTVEIEVRYPHDIHFGWNFRRGVRIEIHMPKNGNANLRTGDGSVRLAGLRGNMDISTGDGAVEVTDVDGVLHAHTGDGHISAAGRFDDLALDTGDGRIDATALPNSKLSTDWRINTGDGSVSLRVPETLAADVELHTSDGHIDFDLPITTSGRFRSNTINGKMNGGGRMLSVHTGDGSIRLARS